MACAACGTSARLAACACTLSTKRPRPATRPAQKTLKPPEQLEHYPERLDKLGVDRVAQQVAQLLSGHAVAVELGEWTRWAVIEAVPPAKEVLHPRLLGVEMRAHVLQRREGAGRSWTGERIETI